MVPPGEAAAVSVHRRGPRRPPSTASTPEIPYARAARPTCRRCASVSSVHWGRSTVVKLAEPADAKRSLRTGLQPAIDARVMSSRDRSSDVVVRGNVSGRPAAASARHEAGACSQAADATAAPAGSRSTDAVRPPPPLLTGGRSLVVLRSLVPRWSGRCARYVPRHRGAGCAGCFRGVRRWPGPRAWR